MEQISGKVHAGGGDDDDDDEGNSALARKDGQMEMYCRRSRRFAPSTSAWQLFWLTSSCWMDEGAELIACK